MQLFKLSVIFISVYFCVQVSLAANCKSEAAEYVKCQRDLQNKTKNTFSSDAEQQKKQKDSGDYEQKVNSCFAQVGCTADAFNNTERAAISKCTKSVQKKGQDNLETCIKTNGDKDFVFSNDTDQDRRSSQGKVSTSMFFKALNRCKKEKGVDQQTIFTCINQKAATSAPTTTLSPVDQLKAQLQGGPAGLFSSSGAFNLVQADTLFKSFCTTKKACDSKLTSPCKTAVCNCYTEYSKQIDEQTELAKCLEGEKVTLEETDLKSLAASLKRQTPDYCATASNRDICQSNNLASIFAVGKRRRR
jgi:hypothetical protein